MRLSARNQIPATITAITVGEATANVELDAGGVRLVASITVEAARELGLAKGTEVTAVIKASDVIVAAQLSAVVHGAPGGWHGVREARRREPVAATRPRERPRQDQGH